MTFEALHISQTINCAPAAVAAFVSDPRNLPKWAGGLSSGISNQDGRWVAQSPMGEVEVRFLGGTELGILDHDVVLPDGSVAYNPLRVIRNDDGSELVFTLYRRPNTTDHEFEQDRQFIRDDLAQLREILEGAS